MSRDDATDEQKADTEDDSIDARFTTVSEILEQIRQRTEITEAQVQLLAAAFHFTIHASTITDGKNNKGQTLSSSASSSASSAVRTANVSDAEGYASFINASNYQ